MDLKLSGSTLVIESGDLVLVDGLEAIAQDVTTRLRMFLGEWFLNTKAGVPYFERILVKNPSVPDVLSILSEVVTKTPGVQAITEGLTWDYSAADRSATVAFKANTIAGPLTYDQELVLGL